MFQSAFVRRLFVSGTALLVLLAASGCPGFSLDFPLLGDVRVELVNDTSFDVAPHIVFSEDDGLSGLLGARELSTGLIPPGEVIAFTFDCDRLGLILSENPEQILPGDLVAIADSSSRFERDEEFGCGDTLTFTFLGDGEDFGVTVARNGRVID